MIGRWQCLHWFWMSSIVKRIQSKFAASHFTSQYSLILWLSFFCRSRTSAMDNSSGSCFMRMLSSARSFSNFSASSRELESRLRISSIKSFDCLISLRRLRFVRLRRDRNVRQQWVFCYAIALLWGKKRFWILFQWQITLFCRRRAFKL